LESEEAARLRERIWETVNELTPPQRASILLFYRHDLGCHDIARILEIPIATVKSHLHRARLRLRERLESLEPSELQAFRNLAG
jgi:RNA polymerase sigma-70 factor (ECF subfamily)